MNSMRRSAQTLFALFDIFLSLASPLFVLVFIVGMIILFDDMVQYNRFVNQLEASSATALGEVVEGYDPEQAWVMVEYDLPSGETDYGFLRARHHPFRSLEGLQQGQRLWVRFPAENYDSNAVLESFYPSMRASFPFVRSTLIPIGLAWAVLIFYPQILYTGFAENAWTAGLEGRGKNQ